MSSKFFFSLESIKPQIKTEAGSLTSVTSKETQGLINISFANLILKKRGLLPPIWHPNAHKVGYCIEGNILVSLRTPSQQELFTVKKGDMFFIPQGFIHHIENIDEQDSVICFALNHSTPETMYLSKSVGSISNNIFNGTFKTKNGFVEGLTKSKDGMLLNTLPSLKKVPILNNNVFKFDIDDSMKAISTKGGYLQVGTKTSLSALNGLGILTFGLNTKGIVEPHWHTNAGELVYIVKGKTRITVLSPEGNAEILDVKGGEGVFAPASYFHNIENVGSDEVKVVAFFTHEDPDYIGIGEVMGSYSNELLESIFNTSPGYFDNFNKPEKPLVIVPV